jgi:hypothetical protein
MLFIKKYQLLIPALIVGVSMFFACTKEKTPTPVTPEPTKWEKVAGNYKVYDTLGEYLYNMDIIYIHDNASNTDSLRFENFNGNFDFTVYQSFFSNWPEMLIRLGSHNPAIDKDGHSWQLVEFWPNSLDNEWKNDSIRLHFKMNNIAYWITDAIPYYSCDCKQVAVKQH